LLCVLKLPFPSLPLPNHAALAWRLMLAIDTLHLVAALTWGSRRFRAMTLA
jgi:hypothetical protein